jgi:dTMP kinase
MTSRRQGVFITLDGLGGAGKTTTIQHLVRYLTERGYPVHATTEPSPGPLGQTARQQTDTYAGHALACLVAADRYHHLAAEIRPALAAGKVVICDRYIASSYVFQRMDGVPLSFIEDINRDADRPDLTVILIADAEVAAGRIARRGAHNRFESGVATSRSEVDLYRDTADRLRSLGYALFIIDTTGTQPEHVAAQIGRRIAGLTSTGHEVE